MSLVIFGVGVLVFFLTIYGTVIAGGLRLTKQQLEASPELAKEPGDFKDGLTTRDFVRSNF